MTGHLLVVDDSPTIRKLVELTFRATPWTVDYAASGREGISLARTGTPDVILLDFVLPDMRGLDVCAMLATDPRTQHTPVILMSAKDESIRHLFKAYPSVVDFVPKPFSPEELSARVRTATADQNGKPRPRAQAKSRFSHAQKEAAAKVVFGKMSKAFAMIPSWLAQMGPQSPSGFFARKILSAELLGELLEALTPFYRDALASEQATALAASIVPRSPVAADASDSPISGSLLGWPSADVLQLFGASGRTGELRFTRENATVIAYYRRGEIVLVTSLDPKDHVTAECGPIAAELPDLDAAEAEQRRSGKPFPVSLAERDALPSSYDLRRLLHRAGRKLLLDTLDVRKQSFAWRELPALPAFVETYARYVPTSRSTEPFVGGAPAWSPETGVFPSLKQLSLQRLRDTQAAESALPAPTIVFDRVAGFSSRIREVTLDARERRVLALIDGRYTIQQISVRAGLDELAARRILKCLFEIGLVTNKAERAERPVMILENGADGFSRSLEAMLRDRPQPIALLSLTSGDDVVEAAVRELPRTLILNAEASRRDVHETARALRGRDELRGMSLVALLDFGGEASAAELEAAGFDAVLVKPVAVADLEPWIAP